MPYRGLEGVMHQLAGSSVASSSMGGVDAANTWAGTQGMELVHALNVKAGNVLQSSYKDLDGVCNQLAGTTGWAAEGCLNLMAGNVLGDDPTVHMNSVNPTQGAVGTLVTVLGTGFSRVRTVNFKQKGQPYWVTDLVVIGSDTQFTCSVPAGLVSGTCTINTCDIGGFDVGNNLNFKIP